MTDITVRVTRTYDVKVQAEYGDDDAALIAKAVAVLDDGDPKNDPPPGSTLCSIMDQRIESGFDTLQQYEAANGVPVVAKSNKKWEAKR